MSRIKAVVTTDAIQAVTMLAGDVLTLVVTVRAAASALAAILVVTKKT